MTTVKKNTQLPVWDDFFICMYLFIYINLLKLGLHLFAEKLRGFV